MHWLKDLLTSKGTEGAATSLGVMGPVIAFVALVANSIWGPETVDVADITMHVNNLIAVVGFVVGIYGRIRATKRIGGPVASTALRSIAGLVMAGGLATTLLLGGCVFGKSDEESKALEIQKIVKTSCYITPKVGDLLAVVAHPGFAGVRPTAEFICSQFLGEAPMPSIQGLLGEMHMAQAKDCIAIVNGVCIEAEESDPPKEEG